MPRWGITLPLTGIPLSAHRELVKELPALGYTDVWTAETNGTDAFTPLAMSAATIAELAPERFVLGVGTSSPVIVEGWNGGEFVEPFRRARDTLVFLRSALAGEKVTERYSTFSVHKFRLERPPEPPPKLMLAALRPGMLRLAAKHAGGTITNWLNPADVRKVRAEVGNDTELVARIFVCPTEDVETARAVGRFLISSYLTVPGYAAFHEWLGRQEALAPMHEAWAAGDHEAANAAVSDEIVDELIVHGSPDVCRRRVAEYVQNGLDTPVLAILPTDVGQRELVRALAP